MKKQKNVHALREPKTRIPRPRITRSNTVKNDNFKFFMKTYLIKPMEYSRIYILQPCFLYCNLFICIYWQCMILIPIYHYKFYNIAKKWIDRNLQFSCLTINSEQFIMTSIDSCIYFTNDLAGHRYNYCWRLR